MTTPTTTIAHETVTFRASADPVKRDLEMVCLTCLGVLCDVEHGDDLAVLVSVAAEHADACDGPTTSAPAEHADRGPASLIRPGDHVTVFAHTVGTIGVGRGGQDITGTVTAVEPVAYGWIRGVRLTLDTPGGTFVRDSIDTGVTVWHGFHDARPTDDPDDEAVCRDCGRDVTWVGPNPETDWLHVADSRNR